MNSDPTGLLGGTLFVFARVDGCIDISGERQNRIEPRPGADDHAGEVETLRFGDGSLLELRFIGGRWVTTLGFQKGLVESWLHHGPDYCGRLGSDGGEMFVFRSRTVERKMGPNWMRL